MNALPLPQYHSLFSSMGATLTSSAADVLEDVRVADQRRKDLLKRVGKILRDIDAVTHAARETADLTDPEINRMITEFAAMRTPMIGIVRDLAPEEEWYWSEEWQAGEREIEAEKAAGRTNTYQSDDEFAALLTANRREHAHP